MPGKYSKKGSGAPVGSKCPIKHYRVTAAKNGKNFYKKSFRSKETANNVAHDLRTMGSAKGISVSVHHHKLGHR
jgi:hypothetical protein